MIILIEIIYRYIYIYRWIYKALLWHLHTCACHSSAVGFGDCSKLFTVAREHVPTRWIKRCVSSLQRDKSSHSCRSLGGPVMCFRPFRATAGRFVPAACSEGRDGPGRRTVSAMLDGAPSWMEAAQALFQRSARSADGPKDG